MPFRRLGGRILAPLLSSLVLLFVVSRRPSVGLPTADTSAPALDLRATAFSGFRTASFPVEGAPAPPALLADVCQICFCPLGHNELTADFRNRPQLSAELSVGGPVRSVEEVGRVLRSAQLASYCPSVHVHNASITESMLAAAPADVLAFNVSTLAIGRPTLYWMTSPSRCEFAALTAQRRRRPAS